MGKFPSPESYARSLVSRKSPPVPLAEQDFLARSRAQVNHAKKPRVRAAITPITTIRGRPNGFGFPWIEKRRDKVGAVIRVAGTRVAGPSRWTVLEAARDAVAIRREHGLSIPDWALSTLDDLEAEARKSAGSA